MWTTIRRETGLIEHVCDHGVGHPSAGSIQYMTHRDDFREKLSETLDNGGHIDELDVIDFIIDEPYSESHWGVHGCDGCCGRDDWPGTASNAIRHALLRYQEEVPHLLRDLKENHYLLWWGLMAAMKEAEGLVR